MLKIILFRHLFVAVVVFNIMIINNIIKFPWISLIINSFAEFFLNDVDPKNFGKNFHFKRIFMLKTLKKRQKKRFW